MIYITGDKHGEFSPILDFCFQNNTSKDDIMIILGDACINYHLGDISYDIKKELSFYPITLFCIHGNHEERPKNLKTYKTKEFCGGLVYFEEEFPNILFAKDGEVYDFNGDKTLVIGGAYSVDKDYRIDVGDIWFSSEQPDDEIKKRVWNTLKKYDYNVDTILSHTCPYNYLPYDTFDDSIDQDTVDNSTEYFLEDIERKTDYKTWYCGHFHIDRNIDNMRFRMHNIEVFNKKLDKKKQKYKSE